MESEIQPIQFHRKIDSDNARAYLIRHTNPTVAEALANSTLNRSKERNYVRGEADGLRTLAIVQGTKNPEIGFELANKAINLYRSIGDEYGESSALLLHCIYYHHKGWYQAAHKVLVEAHEKSKRSSNQYVYSLVLFNLGENAQYRLDFSTAIEYYDSAITTAKEGDNPLAYSAAIGAKGQCLLKLGLPLEPHETYESILIELIGFNALANASDMINFLVQRYLSEKDFAKANTALHIGIRFIANSGLPVKLCDLKFLKGRMHFESGEFAKAERSLRAAYNISLKTGNLRQQVDCLELLAKAVRGNSQSNDAFDLLQTSVELKQAIFDREGQDRVLELQTLHQMGQIVDETVELKQKNRDLEEINKHLERALFERQALQAELERMASTDELTGVLNRRRILAIGTELLKRFSDHQRDGVVMIADIDHFKSVNDTYGHSAGDEILRRFAQSCRGVLRPSDSFGRLGGEEFCILLDRTNEEVAARVALRILNAIRGTVVEDIMPGRKLTASLGIATLQSHHKSIEAVLHDADIALYEAKRTGRDRGLFAITEYGNKSSVKVA